MGISTDAEKLHSLLLHNLHCQSPVLSGNMASYIQNATSQGNELVIVIDAPYYNVSEWKKTGKIVHTGRAKDGMTAYAQAVNDLGGFATRNRSMHWVNRVCVETALAIANEIGAEIINELGL